MQMLARRSNRLKIGIAKNVRETISMAT